MRPNCSVTLYFVLELGKWQWAFHIQVKLFSVTKLLIQYNYLLFCMPSLFRLCFIPCGFRTTVALLLTPLVNTIWKLGSFLCLPFIGAPRAESSLLSWASPARRPGGLGQVGQFFHSIKILSALLSALWTWCLLGRRLRREPGAPGGAWPVYAPRPRAVSRHFESRTAVLVTDYIYKFILRELWRRSLSWLRLPAFFDISQELHFSFYLIII